jgi:hypothetical protein
VNSDYKYALAKDRRSIISGTGHQKVDRLCICILFNYSSRLALAPHQQNSDNLANLHDLQRRP